jgi:hypothetical protein
MIILLSKDLMMSSTISAAARASEKVFKVVQTVESAKTKIDADDVGVELLLVDLQTAGIDFEQLQSIAAIDVADRPRLIGYAQHVNIDLINQGREVGLDQVLTRGQLHGNVDGVLNG